ncbi:dynamin family protein [Actinomycetospora flava]|uniref:Dynamin family protein n=1 Tax=Actinomycetospora flava TaxID=3129232 RepID=A0ABU8MEP1_9PSEU
MTGPAAPPLINRVRGLVHRACQIYGGGPALPDLQTAAARLDEPLRVALAGRIKAGKSTLLNALVGQELAATDAGECTRIVTWFRDGHTYRVMAHPRQGPPRQLPPGPTGGLLDIDLQGMRAEDVERLVVDWPSPALRTMTLIDTPGMGSLSAELSRKTESMLGASGEEDDDETEPKASEADAVVYLMRHVHAADVRFLESFRDDPAERRPINTLGVLARADEVGHGRPDALDSAAKIAGRYRDDPRVRALCQTVMPVAGLLAVTAATLREDEFRAINVLAEAPEADVERLLLSADRFATAETEISLNPGLRAALLDRYGMFGLRLSLRLVHSGVATTAGALSRELLARSGLVPLREALISRFAARADVLKARSALLATESVLRRYPFPAADGLRHELEVINSGAHEFAEVRLLDTLRGGGLMLTPQERADAERVLGVDGVEPAARLALPPDAPQQEIVKAAQATLAQWQRRAEHPASARDVREAARVLVRTGEGLLMGALQANGTPMGQAPGGPMSSHGGGPMSNRWTGGGHDRVVGCS